MILSEFTNLTRGVPQMTEKSFSRDLIYYVPSKLVPAFIGLVVVIILTHSLSPSGYGEYAAILAITRLANAFAFGWLRQSILRYYPEYQAQGESREFQEKSLCFLILIIILNSIIAVGMMFSLKFSLEQTILMLSVLLALTFFDYFNTLYQSSRFSKEYAIAYFLQSIVQIIWILGFVFLAKKGYSFALMALSVGYITAIFYTIIKRTKFNIYLGLPFKHWNWRLLKQLLAYGFPMSIWLLSFQMIFQANRLIIRNLRSEAEVGIYASAYDLINGSLSLLMTPFLLAAHPVIMQLWAHTHDRTEIEALIKKVIRYLLLLCTPIFFFSMVIKEKLFIILGKGYGVNGWVVPILVSAAFFGQFAMYAHKGLEISGRTQVMLGVGIITTLLNIAFNLLFVAKYGYEASAVIMIASYLFYIIVIYNFSRQYIRLYLPWKTIFKIAVAVGIATLCVWGIMANYNESGQMIFMSGFFGVIIYLTLLIALGEFSFEYQYLKAFIKRRSQSN